MNSNETYFRRQYTAEEKIDISQKTDWNLKDVLFVPVEGRDVAFRVEHLSKNRIYFVAVDAVGESKMVDMNRYLDDYLKRMPKELTDRMCEMEHVVDDNHIRRSKLMLLSGKNVSSEVEHYYTGADDIEFDGLKTEVERCKSFNEKTAWYWLDTPFEYALNIDLFTHFMGVSSYGGVYGAARVTRFHAVVPCFSIAREPKVHAEDE